MSIKEIRKQIAQQQKEIDHLEELLVKKVLLKEWENIDIGLVYKEDIEAMAGWENELTAAERKTLCRIEQEFALID